MGINKISDNSDAKVILLPVRRNAKKFAEMVKPIYDMFNWTWEGKKTTPTVDDIADTVRSLCSSIEENFDMKSAYYQKLGYYSCSTGGICVKINENRTAKVYMDVSAEFLYVNEEGDYYASIWASDFLKKKEK